MDFLSNRQFPYILCIASYHKTHTDRKDNTRNSKQQVYPFTIYPSTRKKARNKCAQDTYSYVDECKFHTKNYGSY